MKNKKLIPEIRFPEFSGEWVEQRLGEISICEDNKRIPLNEQERQQRKGIYPYWGSTKIMDYIDNYIFDGEYVLLSEDGGYFYNYKDKPIAFYVNGKFWANNHIHVLKIISHNTKFVYYSLAHKNILAYIIGGTRSKLNQKDMKQIKLHIPPTLDEQKKIADFLSSVDEKIEIVSKKIEELKKYKKGMLQKLLDVKCNNGKCEPEFRFPEFSGDWIEKRLGEIVKTAKSGGTPKSTVKEYYNNGNIPFLSINDMTTQGKYITYTTKTITKLGLKNSNAWIIPLNTIIYSMYASVGFVSINKIPLATSQAVINLIVKDNYNIEFIYYYLFWFKKYVPKYIETGTQGNLNSQIVKNFKLHLPPTLAEQQKIANFLSSIDEKIELNEKKLEKLKAYKKGLLQKMFV